MNVYQKLSIGIWITMALVALMAVYVFTGKRSKKVVYAIASLGMALFIGITVVCYIIYRKYF